MSWRGKYIGWFRLLEKEYNKLVPNLTDLEIMQNVTPQDQLIIPTIKTRKNQKPQPNLTLQLSDETIDIRISYRTRESLQTFRNIFKEPHNHHLKKLIEELNNLDLTYETILISKKRSTPKPRIVRKYLSSRLDQQLIEKILDKIQNLRKGTRTPEQDHSIYIQPETPEFVFLRQNTPLNTKKFIQTLQRIKPIYKILLEVKTRRELISAKINKPKLKKNLYRNFVETLNTARSRKLITAEKRRELNDKWKKNTKSREDLLSQIKKLIASQE